MRPPVKREEADGHEKQSMTNQQFTLFDDNVGLGESKGLTLASRLGERLTKPQQTFNRLIKRIEALRSEIEHETQKLDAALAYHGQHIYPRLQRYMELQKQHVRALAPFLDDKRFKGKNNRATLCQIIADQLQVMELDESSDTDGDLRALFERIHRRSFKEAAREEFEEAREDIESMLSDFGLDVDFSEIKPGMRDEDLARKAAETMARLQQEIETQQHAFGPPPRRKTPHQLAKEERERLAEELRKKAIATIYKQLARVLHPDLELDAALKAQKQTLMQELTVAYRDNDMHTLLRLELESIQREEGNIDKLTDDKLAIYNQTLKEQAQNLEQELHDLPLHPRYQPLTAADGPFRVVVKTAGPAEARALDQTMAKLEAHVRDLRSPDGLGLLKAVLRGYRDSMRARNGSRY